MAERKFYRKIYKKSKTKKIIRWCFLLFCFSFFLLVFSLFFLFVYYAKDLPRPENFTEKIFPESTKIYDRTGKILLYELYGETKREIIPLSQIPEHLKQAVITTEDANFYSHFGIDFKGIIRSLKINLKIGQPVYGGSTITQQLIRSSFLTREKSLKRKIREIILTLELERRYSKDQILEWYLNQIPLGINIYGVEAAAKTYFNKSAKDLTVAESAILAALIKAPSYYSPFGEHKDELLIRKDYVLDRMIKEGYLKKEEGENAKKMEIVFAKISRPIKAPHFVFYVLDYLTEKYDKSFLEEDGLKIYTTLDWTLQEAAEKAISDNIEKIKKRNGYNSSLVALNPKNGEILAMVGSADWFGKPFPENCISGKNCKFDPRVNVATYKIGRQPGSSFKPFAYATAFQKGYDDKYVVIDEQTNFGVWGNKEYIPQNYDGKFRGPVTLRESLAQSLNIPSIKVLLYLAGLSDTLENAKKFGITTLNKPESYYGPAIVLGGGEVKLIDMVSAYGVFATEGLRVNPLSVLKIEDSKGNIIEENKMTPKRVLEPEPARLINDILSDNEARAPIFGSHSSLYFENYSVAVKTGTTNNYRDAWTIGYTPSIVAGVWVGNNDNSPMTKLTGLSSSPIWHQFMAKALSLFPKENFTLPANKIPQEPIE